MYTIDTCNKTVGDLQYAYQSERNAGTKRETEESS